jgi:hypothetical protein
VRLLFYDAAIRLFEIVMVEGLNFGNLSLQRFDAICEGRVIHPTIIRLKAWVISTMADDQRACPHDTGRILK